MIEIKNLQVTEVIGCFNHLKNARPILKYMAESGLLTDKTLRVFSYKNRKLKRSYTISQDNKWREIA